MVKLSSFLFSLLIILHLGVSDLPAQRRISDDTRLLQEYVQHKDPVQGWTVVKTTNIRDVKMYVLRVTSQSWGMNGKYDHFFWKHWLVIIEPREVKHTTALLMISGGSRAEEYKSQPPEFLAKLATNTKSIVAILYDVPNQPLVFQNEEKERVEDDLLARAWVETLKTKDLQWIPQLAMAKSAKAAMDSIQGFFGQVRSEYLIEDFVIIGGSKRGWTTWLIAASDNRVKAIIPMVIDVLNIEKSIRHHYAVYGQWALALQDYASQGLLEKLDSPDVQRLLKIVDPLTYKEKLTMPKFVVNSAGDEFFLPDSSRFYFDQLLGKKYLRYVPNCGHALVGTDAFDSVGSFYDAILNKKKIPEYQWSFKGENELTLQTKSKPISVKLWKAHNPKARDFRIYQIGKTWRSTQIPISKDGIYSVKLKIPEKGYTAYFLEVTWKNSDSYPFKFTTGIKVLPDRIPFKNKPLSNQIESPDAFQRYHEKQKK